MTKPMVYFEDFPVGFTEESPEFEASREEMVAYARANDPWPIHVDHGFAAASPFGDVIASFGYVVSLFFRAMHALPVNQSASGEGFIAAVGWQVEFRNAVRPGERLRVRMQIKEKRPSSKPGRGVIVTHNEVLTSEDVKVAIEVTSLYRTRP